MKWKRKHLEGISIIFSRESKYEILLEYFHENPELIALNSNNTQGWYAMKTLTTIPAFLFLAACSPIVVAPDYSGLGNSELGKVLRYSVPAGDVGINYAVSQLVNTPEVLSGPDRSSSLERLGFICQSASGVRCTYDGYATSEVYYSTEHRKERFKTTVHIDVSPNSTSIGVDSKTHREKY